MKYIIIVLSLLALAAVLRLQNYALYPQRGATSDEYAFAFQGISLLTKGVPIAWSAIPLYKNLSHLTIDGLYFPIVQPYLDHPPLFGLLVGAWAILSQETAFEAVRLATIRIIPVILSLISSAFLYLLAKNVYGVWIARWSLAIYATGTLFVINSRIVVAESLLTVFFLFALYVVSVLPKRPPVLQLLVLGVVCALALLIKVLGVVVFLSVVVICFWRGLGVRRLLWITLPFVFGLGVFYLYGRAYDEGLFWAIQTYQGSRSVGPNTLWMLLTSPIIVNKVYYDGWYFWGLFALGLVCVDSKKNMMVVIPAFLYILLLLASVNQTDVHGWYVIPLFPFLALAGGKLLVESIESSRWILFIWAVLVGGSLIHELYAVPFGLTPSVYRWLVGIILAGAFLSLRSKRIGYGMALFFIVGTAIATFQYVHPA